MAKYESDNELIYLVSENNEDAHDAFFEKYDNIIRMKCTKYKTFIESKGFEFNDLFQEGRLGLTQALNDYNEQKNVSFYTFANLCIDRQISTFLKHVTRDKNKILNDSISLDTNVNGIGKPLIELILDENNIDPEQSFIELEEQEELYKKIEDILSSTEKDVFDLRLQGFTYKEIAQLLNVTQKAVDGAMSRIKVKISNMLNKENIS